MKIGVYRLTKAKKGLTSPSEFFEGKIYFHQKVDIIGFDSILQATVPTYTNLLGGSANKNCNFSGSS
jgi:hypothetical protein